MKKYICSLCILLLGALGAYGQMYNVSVSPQSISNIPYGGGTYSYSHSIDTMMSYSYNRFYDPSGRVQSVNGSSIVFKANTGGAASGTLILYFSSDVGEISGTMSYSQAAAPANYSIKVTPATLTLAAGGGSTSASVSYKDRAGAPTQFVGISGRPAWCTVTASGATLSLAYTANQTLAQRQATMTITYSTPGGNQSATFTVTQPALSQWINVSPTTVTANANGGNSSYTATHSFADSIFNLTYYDFTQTGGGQVSGAGLNYIAFKKNDSNVTKSGVITLRFRDPYNSSNILTAMQTISYTQAPQSYNITSPASVNLSAYVDGTASITTTYVDRTGSVALTNTGITGVPSWCTVTYGSGGTFSIKATAENTTGASRSASVTVSFANPLGGTVSRTFSIVQAAASYEIKVTPASFTLAAGGGSTSASVSYKDRAGTPTQFVSVSGAPAWCRVSASGTTLSLSYDFNTDGSTRSKTITVTYSTPGGNKSTTFTITQSTLKEFVDVSPTTVTANANGGNSPYTASYFSQDTIADPIYHNFTQTGDGQVSGAGLNYITFKKNDSNVTKSGVVTLYFKDPANQSNILTAVRTISYTQPPIPFDVKVDNVTNLAFQGQTISRNVLFGTRGGNVGTTLTGYQCNTAPASWCTMIHSNGVLTFTATPNTDIAERTTSATISYTNPISGEARVSATVQITQKAKDYAVSVESTGGIGSADSEGGTFLITTKHQYLTGEPFALQYLSASMNPSIYGSTFAQGDQENKLHVTLPANTSGQTLSGTITITYKHPSNSSYQKAVQVSYSQAPRGVGVYLLTNQFTIPAGGGEKILDYTYVPPPYDSTLLGGEIAFYSHLSGVPQGTTGSNYGLGYDKVKLVFPPNYNYTPYSNQQGIIYFDNGLETISKNFTYTQEPVSCAITVDNVVLDCTAGSKNTWVKYASRPTIDYSRLTNYACIEVPDTSWCTMTHTNGMLTFTAKANPDVTPRSTYATIRYTDPLDNTKTVSKRFQITQKEKDYAISVNSSAYGNPQGGNYTVTLRHTHFPNEPFAMVYQAHTFRTSYHEDHITVTPGTNANELLLHFKPNRGGSTISGYIDLTYKLVGNESYTKPLALHYSQEPRGEGVFITTQHLEFAPAGGTYTIDYEYFVRENHVVVIGSDTLFVTHPILDNWSGFPQGATVTLQGNLPGKGQIRITLPANDSPTPYNETATICFKIGLDDHPITFTYEQKPNGGEPTEQSVTKRVYQDETGSTFNSTITHYDGLARPVQTIKVASSPTGKDVVSFVEYDNMGRADAVNYMSYVASSSTGARVSNPLSEQMTFYNQLFGAGSAQYARSQKIYESGSGLVLKQNAPGENNNLTDGYYNHYGYRLNTSADQIRRFRMQANGSILLDNYYPAETLTVIRVEAKKENADMDLQDQFSDTYEYTNALGQVIAKETRVSDTDRRITYYVYDDMGRQRYVLPHIQATTLVNGQSYQYASLRDYSYYTEYDKYGRVYRQWVPGSEPSISLYDKRGRLVLTQSGEARKSGEWIFTKYDRYDRPIMTGVVTGSEEAHQTALDDQSVFYETTVQTGGLHGYTNVSYPVIADGNACLSITYYDEEGWPGQSGYAFESGHAWNLSKNTRIKGFVSGTKTKVLDGQNSNWLVTATYYDNDYQTLQTVAGLYPDGKEITSNNHNFVGEVTTVRVTQKFDNGATEYGYEKWFEYDAQGRLLWVDQKVAGDQANGSGGRVRIAEYNYNVLGQTAGKAIHNGAETTAYSYDLQGRTRGVESPSFSYWLDFEEFGFPSSGFTLNSYINGQISAVRWKHGNETAKGYGYQYDKLGQLLGGIHIFNVPNENYWYFEMIRHEGTQSEDKNGYDLNGNITQMLRVDTENMYMYEYHYTGNQLSAVTEDGQRSASYVYDANGNMTYDGRRGVNIQYNILDLPERVSANSEYISYIYAADGQKLAAKAVNGSFTYYRGVMVYNGQNELLHMMQPEGTITRGKDTGGNAFYTYNYFKTDHVGSTRAVLAALSTGLTVLQSTDYYPFGLAWDYNDLQHNKYLFGGKELQDAALAGHILGLYDFHARYYDPVLGRWFNVDPALQTVNPYLYCGNNPVIFTDPSGAVFGIDDALIALGIGAAIAAASYTVSVAASPGGFDNWSWGQFFKSIGIGGLSGVATAGIGAGFQAAGQFAGAIGSPAIQGLAHGVAQGSLSALGGGDFLTGLATGALSSWATSAFMAIPVVGQSVEGTIAFSGLVGGITSKATGGNFWQGFGTGVIVAGLNHTLEHEAKKWKTVANLKRTLTRYGLQENTGCVYATVKTIAEYLGLELPADFTIKPVGASMRAVIKEAGLSSAQLAGIEDIIASINSDVPVAAVYMTDRVNKTGHAVAIQEVQMKQRKTSPIFRFRVMDPDNGGTFQIRMESLLNSPTYYQIQK